MTEKYESEITLPQPIAYVFIPGNEPGKRIGIVTFGESGYYATNYDQTTYSVEDCRRHVATLNERLGIPEEVAESMLYGSMYGWDVLAAAAARKHFAR